MIPTIPTILTEADWNQKKGVFAKLFARKTGIAEKLRELKSLYDAVDWKKFDAGEATRKIKSVAAVDAGLAEAKREFAAKVEPVRRKLSEISSLATSVAEQFKKDARIPSSSREHVERLGKDASNFMVALKSMDAEFKAFQDKRTQMETVEREMKRAVDNYLKNRLPTGVRELTAKPDKTKWESFHKETVRGLAAAVAANASTAHLSDKWRTMSVDSWKAVKDDNEIKTKVKMVETAAAELTRILG